MQRDAVGLSFRQVNVLEGRAVSTGEDGFQTFSSHVERSSHPLHATGDKKPPLQPSAGARAMRRWGKLRAYPHGAYLNQILPLTKSV